MQTKRQRRNLAKLALFVHNLPADYGHFAMSSYMQVDHNEYPESAQLLPACILKSLDPNETSATKHECGTTACFCGHGPSAGIKAKRNEEWHDYAARAFGASQHDECNLWHHLFNESWSDDKDEAAKRAAWVLQGQLILFYPGNDLSESDAFTNFEPDWKLIERIANGKA